MLELPPATPDVHDSVRVAAPRPRLTPAEVDPEPGDVHLPVAMTRFFDRTAELEALEHLLAPTSPQRLITLTGTGGAGKTRLAIEAAERWHTSCGGPVWFVPLAQAISSAEAATAIAAALGRLQEGIDPITSVSERISGRATLLVLDNLEQLAGGVEFVHRLICSSIGLKVLATSRHQLQIEGEWELVVPPLPAPSLPTTAERLVEFSSVQLFIDRAQAIRSDFQVTRGNARAVGMLCDRLEGLPLAIELAAGWIQVLTPAQMLEKMENRFELLVSRRRDAGARHRTLWDTIDWSYSLLPPALQAALRALSIFPDDFTTQALSAVCDLPVADALNVLAELQSRSLIATVEADGEMRATMLDSLREFARDQCSAIERLEVIRRYAEFYASMAASAAAAVTGPEQSRWMRWLEAEVHNVQVAISYCLDATAEAEMANVALRLTGSLWRLWFRSVRTAEMRDWILLALESSSQEPSGERGRALIGAAAYAWLNGEHATARKEAETALEMCRVLRMRKEEAEALTMLGIVASSCGDALAATQFHEEALEIRKRHGTSMQAANSLHNLAVVSNVSYALRRARELLVEAEKLEIASHDDLGRSKSLLNLAAIDVLEGEHNTARLQYDTCVTLARLAGLTIDIANSLKGRAEAEIELGDLDGAESALSEAMLIYRDLGNKHGVGLCLHHFGATAWLRGERDDAAEYGRQSLELLRDVSGETEVTSTLALLAFTSSTDAERIAVAKKAKLAVVSFLDPENGLGIVQAIETLCFVVLNGKTEAAIAEQMAIVEAWRAATGCVRPRLLVELCDSVHRTLGGIEPAIDRVVAQRPRAAGSLAACAEFAAALRL